MRRVGVAVLLAICVPVTAWAKDKDRFKAALSAGQKLEEKGDLKGAQTQLQVALSLVPEDGRTLSELGVVALRLKDYAAAEDFTRRSIRSTADKQILGASLYNLGMILEARGDKKGAIEAYVRSMAARPHHVVRERLAKLDPARAQALDPLAPHAMDGPFASIADYCKKRQAEWDEEQHEVDRANGKSADWAAECGVAANRQDLTDIESEPHGVVEIVSTLRTSPCNVQPCQDTELLLAIMSKQGWFVSRMLDYGSVSFRSTSRITVDKLEATSALGGDVPVIELRWTRHGSEESAGDENDNETTTERLALAGMGPSGKPTIMEGLVTRTIRKTSELSFDVKVGRGTIEVKAGSGKSDMDAKELESLLGTHSLVFP